MVPSNSRLQVLILINLLFHFQYTFVALSYIPSGKRDGQTTMVNTNGTVDVYQWDASQAKWVKIGNVVGSSGSTQSTSGKTLYEGTVSGKL